MAIIEAILVVILLFIIAYFSITMAVALLAYIGGAIIIAVVYILRFPFIVIEKIFKFIKNMCNVSRKIHCQECEYYSEKGTDIYCGKSEKNIGYTVNNWANTGYPRKVFNFSEYKPEWCPLTISNPIVKKEKLSDKFVLVDNGGGDAVITLGYKTYHTDKYGREILESVEEVEVKFDDLCTDEHKKNKIKKFLNQHCKLSSFYVDENYGIYCLEKDGKEIDINIRVNDVSLPSYINFVRVPGYFCISGGGIKTLKGCPKYVGLGFNCSHNKIENFDDAPLVINFKEKEENLSDWEGKTYDNNVSFDCSYNLIKSLDGCPNVKKGSIICDRNKIVSFKGIQSHIDGSLICVNNNISSFDDLPKISGTFNGSDNLFTNVNEDELKKITSCSKVCVGGCDRKIKSMSLTNDFLKLAVGKYGNDDFEFVGKTYWGEEPTTLTSENCKIGIKCKKHNFYFETYPKDFLSGEKQCPICKMEKYGFTKKTNTDFKLVQNGIYCSKNCKDEELVKKIVNYINYHISSNRCILYINADYTIDAESDDLASLNNNNPYYGVTVTVATGAIPDYINFGEIVANQFVLTSKKWDASTEKFIENDKLNTFRGCPRRVFGDFICKDEKISSFMGMPIFIGGLFDISNNELTDDAWEYAKEHMPRETEFGDYKIPNNKFVKYRKELY